MMPDRLVLDTDIVIHLLKKQPQTVARFIDLLAAQTILLLSPVVVAEIYAGAFQREHKEIELLFSFCKRISIDSATGQQAGHYARRYRKAHQGISLEDYLLAASARQNRCPLWTSNRKHYPMDDIALFDAV
ncbi:MAG: type II toxin-antitoxin system VapC family toxin [Methylococcales bacterium]|nr:type II toxin-antitoxin system VapC family toxin [Methylococcales bacterium]